jgi:hypothetical protein
MRHWIHAQFATSVPGRTFWAGTGEDEAGSVHIVFYRDAATGDIPHPGLPDELLLCHVLLADLPEFAISEALESLTDLWRFHAPAMLAAGLQGPVSERVSGGRIVSSRRPDPMLIAEG